MAISDIREHQRNYTTPCYNRYAYFIIHIKNRAREHCNQQGPLCWLNHKWQRKVIEREQPLTVGFNLWLDRNIWKSYQSNSNVGQLENSGNVLDKVFFRRTKS